MLAADTVVAVGRRIMPKAETLEDAEFCLRFLSGRSHRVYSGVALVAPDGKLRQRRVETRVRFKRLSREEIDAYLVSGEWRGKAGAYGVQGAGRRVRRQACRFLHQCRCIPLYETVGLLTGDGYPVHFNWLSSGQPGGRKK